MTDKPASTSAPTSAPGGAASPRVHPERQRRVRTALRLFSVAAWVTGVLLLLLCARMIMEYGFHMDVSLLSWVAILHGWVYALFLLATLNLGMKARWSTSQWIITAIAGVVPFLSFFVEAWRRKEVTEEFDL